MWRAARLRVSALAVLLMTLMAFAIPATGQGAASQASDHAAPAPPGQYAADRKKLADLMVESLRNERRFSAQEISTEEWRAGLQQIDPQMGAILARWRARGQEGFIHTDASNDARERMAVINQQYGYGPQEPTLWEMAQYLFFQEGPTFLKMLWQGLPVLLLGGVLLIFVLVQIKALFGSWGKRNQAEAAPEVSDNYGTARYADMRTGLADADAGFLGVFFGKSSAPSLKAVPLEQQQGAPILSTPEHHTLIVARTRTGKGTRVIVPTLLRYSGSAIVIDPKGENAAITARIRRQTLNSVVHVINPWGELADAFKERGLTPATFNPLDVLVRDDPNAVAVAQGLAGAVCPSPPGDKDRFWTGSAANVLTAVLLWITDQPGEQKTLARAREIVSLSRKDFTDRFLVPMAASSAFGGAIKEMVSPYLDLAQETYSGIMSNLSEATKFLSDPQVKAATAVSSFDMADLIREAVTVYLVIPPDRIDTQRTWLRLMTTAAMHTFKRYPLKGRPPHRCMILMDEFPALGRIEDLPRDIATMSGYGIDFTLIVQGLDQLKDLYGAAAGTILSNCAYKWFCNVNDLESANYLSESLGKMTVQTVGHGEGQNLGPGGAGRSENVNYGETGRPLLMPDEVLALGRDVAIVLNPDDRPHYVRPVDYWRMPDAFASLASIYPHLYWKPPLAYDDNPYFVRSQKTDGDPKGRQSGGERQRAAYSNGQMTRADALDLLGLSEGASTAEVRAAWKRLMTKVHPDTGGSARFAQMLNEARDVLLSGSDGTKRAS